MIATGLEGQETMMSRESAFPLEPAPIHVSDDVLADLRQRLALTR
jgi:hypothetical protein